MFLSFWGVFFWGLPLHLSVFPFSLAFASIVDDTTGVIGYALSDHRAADIQGES